MYYKIKTRKQGGSVAITLPADVARKLMVKEAAVLYIVEDRPGEYRLTPYDPEVAAALEAHREAIVEYRDVFKKLAE